jgi:hypothetical protein
MSGLRAAAAALIAEAPEATVHRVLRMLVDSLVPTAPRANGEAPPPAPTPHRAPAPASRAASPARSAAAASPVTDDAAWLDLRSRVKAAMAERGVSITDVAAAIGRSEIAVRITLGSRKAPKPIVQRRLQAWLADKPTDAREVAAHVATFPGLGAERRGNGHDAGGAYSSTGD